MKKEENERRTKHREWKGKEMSERNWGKMKTTVKKVNDDEQKLKNLKEWKVVSYASKKWKKYRRKKREWKDKGSWKSYSL